MNIQYVISQNLMEARRRLVSTLKSSYGPKEARMIIARYTGAFAVNFTDWIGKTYPWTRHEKTRYVLADNLRCEQTEDHVGMLLEFAFYAKTKSDPEATREILEEIRHEFRNISTAGLFGTALLTTLEVASQDFIHLLEKMGQDLGLKAGHLQYTRVHGVADLKHAEALTEALVAEANEYSDAEIVIQKGMELSLRLLEKIFTL